MDIADGPKEGDITLKEDGLTVFLQKEASSILSGATIDFSDERGFAITGMQQGSCCG